MRSQNEPMALTFSFECPQEFCNHNLTKAQRDANKLAGVQTSHCPMKRKIRLYDTVSFLPFSLSKIIENAHDASSNEGLPLSEVFSSSKSFCDAEQYTEEQFMSFIKCKLELPFELITDFHTMNSITTPPPRHHFASTLRGTTEISTESYNHFLHIWQTLQITNLTEVKHSDFYIHSIATASPSVAQTT